MTSEDVARLEEPSFLVEEAFYALLELSGTRLLV